MNCQTEGPQVGIVLHEDEDEDESSRSATVIRGQTTHYEDTSSSKIKQALNDEVFSQSN